MSSDGWLFYDIKCDSTPPPPTPLREISARIRNMEMTARALRQDSGRALKISTAPQSAKAKFSQGRSVKRVVWMGRGRDARGCSLAGNTLFQLHHKIRFNILSIFLSLCTFFHSTTHSLSSYLPLSLSPRSVSLLTSPSPSLLCLPSRLAKQFPIITRAWHFSLTAITINKNGRHLKLNDSHAAHLPPHFPFSLMPLNVLLALASWLNKNF